MLRCGEAEWSCGAVPEEGLGFDVLCLGDNEDAVGLEFETLPGLQVAIAVAERCAATARSLENERDDVVPPCGFGAASVNRQ